jgi:hypothetical protein
MDDGSTKVRKTRGLGLSTSFRADEAKLAEFVFRKALTSLEFKQLASNPALHRLWRKFRDLHARSIERGADEKP